MTSEVAAQGSRYQEVRAWTCFVGFFCDFPTDFPTFSLFVSLFLFSFLLGIYLIFLFWPCLFTETGRLKKDKVKVDFQNSIFQVFFRHLKASGVLQVCDSGLILWTYKVTVLAQRNQH